MSSWLDSTVARNRRRGVLVDTNFLLLLFQGWLRSDLIGAGRTSGTTESDFEYAAQILHQFHTLITTPHILTEVSNLSKQLRGFDVEDFNEEFARRVPQWLEVHVEAKSAIGADGFEYFSLPDTAFKIVAMDRRPLVLSWDGPLARQLDEAGVDVVTLGRLRTAMDSD
ncbi:MAG: hypothetical protein NTZ56_19705 [Acidobacteria bacterium]|nr:hypothetical protein [Acidobacteriota bacterium]